MSARIGFVKDLPAHPTEVHKWMEYAWLESSMKAPRLARISDATDWAEPATWPAGRLFGPRGEYRWRRIEKRTESRLHVVLLLEDTELPSAFKGRLELERFADEDLILWGKWVASAEDPGSNPKGGPMFYASEIPRFLVYPLEWTERPQPNVTPRLTIRRYRAIGDDGQEFVRCVKCRMKEGLDED